MAPKKKAAQKKAAAKKIAKKASIAKAIKPKAAAKKQAKPKPAKKAANTSPVGVKLPPLTSYEEYKREASTLRLHIIYFRKRLGHVTGDTPEWASVGAARLESALERFADFPELPPYEVTIEPEDLVLTEKKAPATEFAGTLYRLTSNLWNRSLGTPDRREHEQNYEKADAAIDGVMLDLEAFGQPIGTADGEAVLPVGITIDKGIFERIAVLQEQPGIDDAARAEADQKTQAEATDADDEGDDDSAETEDSEATTTEEVATE